MEKIARKITDKFFLATSPKGALLYLWGVGTGIHCNTISSVERGHLPSGTLHSTPFPFLKPRACMQPIQSLIRCPATPQQNLTYDLLLVLLWFLFFPLTYCLRLLATPSFSESVL